MGSPVSAVVANLYMEFFELTALAATTLRPRVWKRYVDDTFRVCRQGTEEELLHHLNSLRPSHHIAGAGWISGFFGLSPT